MDRKIKLRDGEGSLMDVVVWNELSGGDGPVRVYGTLAGVDVGERASDLSWGELAVVRDVRRVDGKLTGFNGARLNRDPRVLEVMIPARLTRRQRQMYYHLAGESENWWWNQYKAYVRPRYTGGSGAMVDTDIAMRVAQEERHAHEIAMEGVFGCEMQARAINEGLAGIVYVRVERSGAVYRRDMLTGEVSAARV